MGMGFLFGKCNVVVPTIPHVVLSIIRMVQCAHEVSNPVEDQARDQDEDHKEIQARVF